jgi:cell division protein FtsI/penicillin-binding protein 2
MYPLAIAQHPTYDLNAMASGGPEAIEIMKDERNVLMNYAIQSRAEPGSIFKMVTALAALTNNKLSVTEMISDEGPFTKYTKNVSKRPPAGLPRGSCISTPIRPSFRALATPATISSIAGASSVR